MRKHQYSLVYHRGIANNTIGFLPFVSASTNRDNLASPKRDNGATGNANRVYSAAGNR